MKLFQKLSLAAATALVLSSTMPSQAQLIVRVRPARPALIAVRPVAPSPRHVWVEEDWREQNGAYAYNGGRWVEAPYAGARWIPGHWKDTPRRGWIWRAGHWAR